jgi:hypothetical protein
VSRPDVEVHQLSAQSQYRRGCDYLWKAHQAGSGQAGTEAMLAATAYFAAATAQMAIYEDTQLSKVPLFRFEGGS